MLQIIVPGIEGFNDETQEFIMAQKNQPLALEHSLVSISKWESKWCKPFLGKTEKTNDEVIDYVKCMTLTQNVHPDVYARLTEQNVMDVQKYIEAPMTATWFSDNTVANPSRETITSELIYYWMIALEIPFECQKWHLNRLLTLVRVCTIKNQPAKKMTPKEIMERNARLNEERRKKFNTNG